MVKELTEYLNKKVIVLSEHSTVEEAAKAMAAQKVGCVLTHDHDGVTGLVTDRDLCCYVLAENISPQMPLKEVLIQEEVNSVHEEANLDDVIEVMRQHGVRRVPVLSAKKIPQKVLGIITLDDLVIHGDIDLETLREIIEPQVRLFPRHSTSKWQRRREARREQVANIFLKSVAREMGIEKNQAEPMILFLLKSLVERITYTEAQDLISSLPKDLQEDLWEVTAGPNRRITAEFILSEMKLRFGLTLPAAENRVRGFWTGLELYLLNNECNHILSQLPQDLQVLLIGEIYERPNYTLKQSFSLNRQ